MTDETPILRADATDDDEMPEWERNLLATGNSEVSAEEASKFATGGKIEPLGDGTDAVPAFISPCEQVFEAYENGEGGWSYRRVW